MCISIFIIIWFNKKLILIKKSSKENQINIMSCEIKYFDIYLSLKFYKFNDIFLCLLTLIVLEWFDYIYEFFYLHNCFIYKNMLKKSIYIIFFRK